MSIAATGASLISKASALRTGLVVAAVASLLGFGAGWKVHGWRVAKQELRATQAEIRVVERESVRRRAISVKHAEQQREIEEFYADLPEWWRRIVDERPGLRDVELGPVGLCLWNAANAGPAGGDRSCAAAEGGTVATGGERPAAGSDQEPPAGGADLQRARDTAERADRHSD